MTALSMNLRRRGYLGAIRVPDAGYPGVQWFVTIRRMDQSFVIMVARASQGESLDDALNNLTIFHGPIGPEVLLADLHVVLRRAWVISRIYADMTKVRRA